MVDKYLMHMAKERKQKIMIGRSLGNIFVINNSQEREAVSERKLVSSYDVKVKSEFRIRWTRSKRDAVFDFVLLG